jgi:hypothetical protein
MDTVKELTRQQTTKAFSALILLVDSSLFSEACSMDHDELARFRMQAQLV